MATPQLLMFTSTRLVAWSGHTCRKRVETFLSSICCCSSSPLSSLPRLLMMAVSTPSERSRTRMFSGAPPSFLPLGRLSHSTSPKLVTFMTVLSCVIEEVAAGVPRGNPAGRQHEPA